MQTLLIVAHCPSPNTESIARAVEDGARDVAGDAVRVRRTAPLEAGPDDVQDCDAIVLGSTENFGYMAGALKDFFERTYYPCLESKQGLPYGMFVKGGEDGRGAVASIERIVTGLRWRAVQPPLVMTGKFQESWLAQCREYGATLAAGLEAGLY